MAAFGAVHHVEAEVAGRDGQGQAHDGFARGHVEDDEAAVRRAACDQLLAIGLEAEEGRLRAGGYGALDDAAGEGGDPDGTGLKAGDGGAAVGAYFEAIGRRGERDAARRAQSIEGYLHQRRGVPAQRPERIAGR